MKVRLKNLRDQVLVITGASSGIGLSTARMAARRGAKGIVVAARSDEPLQSLVNQLQSLGSKAIAIEADVSNYEDVRRLSDAAIQHFGGYDTWVNNAGVSIYGEVLKVPVEDERKLFETNFWGLVYGSKVAAEHLKQRGGALINIGSVAGDASIPLQSAYCASKHAVKAYTNTLRMELEKEGAPVSVTLIKPTAIDTPFFQHAKTHMGAQPTEPSPMYTPEEVARGILHAAQTPTRSLLIGDLAPLQSMMGRLMPKTGERYMKATMFEGQKDQRRQPGPKDNRGLDEASGDLRERGGVYDAKVFEQSVYTRAAMNPMLAGTVAVGTTVALAALFGGGRVLRGARKEKYQG
jgi:short-subunit dehydrogenase